MLEGTDLGSAYQTLSGPASMTDYYEEPVLVPTTSKKETPIQPPISRSSGDESLLQKQFETDQKLAALVSELKKRKSSAPVATTDQEQPSYFDKLFGKKKELYKVLQLSLIITLGLSLHFLMDHYLSRYISDNDMSFERQLILRLLYPAAVLFVLWNLRVFVK